MKKYFIQHDSSPDAVNCLRIAAAWHRSYAQRHGLEYVESYAPCSAAPYSKNSEGQVWFFKLLHQMPDNAVVMYADADVLIVKPEIDVLAILPEKIELMMLGGKDTWINSGVVLMRNTPNLRTWFEYLLHTGPVDAKEISSYIDHRFIPEFHRMGSGVKDAYPRVNYAFFDDRYNWFPKYGAGVRNVFWKESDAIIKAWHGTEAVSRARIMKAEMAKLEVKFGAVA